MIWLTNGYRWLGPYLDVEVRALLRGACTLREDPYGPEVWRVRAETRQLAQAAFARVARGRR